MNNSIHYKTSHLVNMAALVIVLAGAMFASAFVNSLLMALFISINLSQPVAWLQGKKVPKGVAIAAVFVLIILILVIFGQLISVSFSSFNEELPKYESNINALTSSVDQVLQGYGISISQNTLTQALNPSKVMSTMTGFLSDLGGVMGDALTILFLTLFLLLEFDTIPLKLNAIAQKKESFAYLKGIGQSLRHYLSIKTITSLLTGILIWIALELIGVDYAVIWAIIAFCLNYIPNIGSFIAAVPAVLFAMIQLGVSGMIWTIIIFVVANTLVGNVIEPKMMGKGLGLSTFIVFLSLIFWGFIFGTVGMFLSVPLTMTLKIIFEQKPDTKWAAILLGTKEDAELSVKHLTHEDDPNLDSF